MPKAKGLPLAVEKNGSMVRQSRSGKNPAADTTKTPPKLPNMGDMRGFVTAAPCV